MWKTFIKYDERRNSQGDWIAAISLYLVSYKAEKRNQQKKSMP